MATFKDVQNHLTKNPAFLGELLTDPKIALKSANLTLENVQDVKRLETFIKLGQENLSNTAKHVGLRMKPNKWGIGAGCCNGRSLIAFKNSPK